MSASACADGDDPAGHQLDAHGLPGRWAGRDRFVVLEAAFGNGRGFLSTWAAWREDGQRCRSLHYIAIEPCPWQADRLAEAHRDGPLAALADQLATAWPPLTPNIHRLVFENGRVELLLVIDDLVSGLRELVAEVDVFGLDRSVADRATTGARSRICKGLARLAASGATAVVAAADGELAAGLRSAGFEITAAAATAHQAGALAARFAPRFLPARPPARRHRPVPDRRRDALIIGAGLAGCATAAALAEQGWSSTLIDRLDGPAGEASGNSAGLFHGVVHGHDGHHARFNRAAALEAARCFERLIPGDPGGAVALGQIEGLLRLGSGLPSIAAMAELLARLRLPPGHVIAVDAQQASELAGLPIASAAWFFPRGGWIRPARLAQTWLDAAGTACRTIYGVDIGSIRPIDDEWTVFDRSGAAVASAANLVLANAGGAPALLEGLAGRSMAWPLQRLRGQTSQIELSALPGLRAPRVPLTGAGYLLPAIDGQLIFGATAQADDDGADVRPADHQLNKARLASLSPALQGVDAIAADRFTGRTGWRCVADDRLPLIGAVPHAWAGGPDRPAPDQPRLVPRREGLYLFIGLGSRGITWAPIGSRLLAGMLSGAPLPLEAALLDAVDPARFASRSSRRQAAESAASRQLEI